MVKGLQRYIVLILLLEVIAAAVAETVAIRNAGEGIVAVNVPDSASNQVWMIEYSPDLTNWSWCFTQTTGAAPVMFFTSNQMFFRGRKE